MSQQLEALTGMKRGWLGQAADHLRRLFRPRIGTFYQYDPRPLGIPDRYLRRPPLESGPVVSLVTPSLNQEAYLSQAIQSVVSQGYPHLEYVVQDGGSTDDSVRILERWKAHITYAESGEDGGQADALNRGFARTTGSIMGYLNSDDMLLPGAIRDVVDYFAAHPEVDVVYGHRVVVDGFGLEIGRWVLPPHDDSVLPWADYIPQETLFWRREIWEKAGGSINPTYRFAMDWDLILRFLRAGARFSRIGRFVGAFRVHSEQKTSAQLEDIGHSEMDRIRTEFHGRPVSPYEVRWKLRGYMRRQVLYHWLFRLGLLRH